VPILCPSPHDTGHLIGNRNFVESATAGSYSARSAEFVEEVEDEGDFVELVFDLRLRGFQDGEALAAGVITWNVSPDLAGTT
jgi:hypothetical protein